MANAQTKPPKTNSTQIKPLKTSTQAKTHIIDSIQTILHKTSTHVKPPKNQFNENQTPQNFYTYQTPENQFITNQTPQSFYPNQIPQTFYANRTPQEHLDFRFTQQIQPHNNFTPTHNFNFSSPSLNATWGTVDQDFLRKVWRQDGTEVERGYFQSFNGILQGGSSFVQSSIDNIQQEEPRYHVCDIRRRGCGTDGHL